MSSQFSTLFPSAFYHPVATQPQMFPNSHRTLTPWKLCRLLIVSYIRYSHDAFCRHQDRPVNVDDINYFYSQSSNERVPCDALPDIDLQPWAEAPPAPLAHAPPPKAPVYAGPPRQAAELLPIVSKTARSAVNAFVEDIAPLRSKAVFRAWNDGRRPVYV